MKNKLTKKLDAFDVNGHPGQYRSLQEIPKVEGAAVPPTEFRLFFKGENYTTKGTFLFDEKSAEKIIDIWQSRGIDLMGDYEHMSLVEPPIIAPASTRKFDIEVRDGELWAVHIDWTEKAAGYISAGEYRYFSAAFDVDPETMQIVRLLNFALTNLPAADKIDPLVQARIAARSYDPEGYALGEKRARVSTVKHTDKAPYTMRTLKSVAYEAAPVVYGAWNANAAIKHAKAYAGIKSNEDLQDPAKQKKFSKFFAYVADEGKDLADYKLPHHDIHNGKFVTSRQGVIAAGNAIQGSRGGVNIPDSDLTAVKKHLEQHYHQFDMQAPWEPKKSKTLSETKKMKFLDKIKAHMDAAKMDKAGLCKACKLDDEEMDKMLDSEPGEMDADHAKVLDKMAEALDVPVEHLCSYAMGHDPEGDEDGDEDEDEDDAEGEEMKALKAVVLSVTGKSDVVEAKAVLQAMATTHAGASDLAKQVVALSAEIATIKGNETNKEFDRLLTEAKTAGKLAPADLASTVEGTPGAFVAQCRDDAKNGLKSLRAFLSALSPKVKTIAANTHREPSMAHDGVSDVEAEIAAKMGVDPKKLVAAKSKVKSI